MDYGSTIYTSISKTQLNFFNTIHNTALRVSVRSISYHPLQKLICTLQRITVLSAPSSNLFENNHTPSRTRPNTFPF
ncbi:hypothetical protein PGB90_006947 [Kerria lacca]